MEDKTFNKDFQMSLLVTHFESLPLLSCYLKVQIMKHLTAMTQRKKKYFPKNLINEPRTD